MWILPEDHCHDEDGECIPVQVPDPEPEEYSLQVYDLIGISFLAISNATGALANAVGGLHNSVQGACHMFAREFAAAANLRRTQADEAKHRRLLADDLESLVRGESHE